MADTKSLPAPAALKDRFKAGSIPLQSDFADLIDMAAAGAGAIGVASGQDGSPGMGMRLSSDGKLEPNAVARDYTNASDDQGFSPIAIDKTTNALVVDLDYGLEQVSSGLAVKASTGIEVGSDGVSVNKDIIANSTAGAKAVGQFTGQDGKPGQGMRITSAGKLEPNLESHDYDGSEAGVLPLKIDSSTNMMVVDLDLGLVASDDGLSVKASTGIKVDANGVSVDMAYVVPRGIIVMFSGSAAPTGWAFCNGSNGTPDLRDRFIKGSQNFNTSTGGAKQNTYTPTGTITIDEHTLTIDEMPSHTHSWVKQGGGNMSDGGTYPEAGGNTWSWVPYPTGNAFEPTGGNRPHSHTGSFNGFKYNQNNEPQYFALAFIMKL